MPPMFGRLPDSARARLAQSSGSKASRVLTFIRSFQGYLRFEPITTPRALTARWGLVIRAGSRSYRNAHQGLLVISPVYHQSGVQADDQALKGRGYGDPEVHMKKEEKEKEKKRKEKKKRKLPETAQLHWGPESRTSLAYLAMFRFFSGGGSASSAKYFDIR
ncbi:hypothetical protein PCH_Pc12g09780 [Penicillium rubens Wisconsin 54-1255]|uniref:Uncharacterized protein n=1 Tax=Penicillium rubens (strain ATCC 28089 / DSM 1075 / NRRL 1951 / Wisconsin 54-1255) TaxID=500485 RepID=B6GZS7_PENRW|nr:hypothetical protein PCH_Pc12g09780 [Penicillium rubens Wisconsin 54-1255]